MQQESATISPQPRQIAHFLLLPELQGSPPNDALARAFQNLGFSVDWFAPVDPRQGNAVEFGYRWIIRNLFSPRWRKYSAFVCTSEDPVVVAGLLSVVWRKPLIFLADEIRTEGYLGPRSKFWKKLCRWCMRRAGLTIVNDVSRLELQREYASLTDRHSMRVYPGCFVEVPSSTPRSEQRKRWNIDSEGTVLGFSGLCSLEHGADWALGSLEQRGNLTLLIQPLGMRKFDRYLLENHRYADQILLQEKRLSWQDAWSSMGGVDVGVSIYHQRAAQFQNMGTSSNRLCMFLAMGVPVIVSKQPSFEFIEEFNCGFMVSNADEFSAALDKILADLEQMKINALRCAREYIKAESRFAEIVDELQSLLISPGE